LSGDTTNELERAINVLERFGRRDGLPFEVRTAVRCRLVRLFSQVELERAKIRLVEGNYSAARYHMAASEPRSLRRRAALLGLRVRPQLVRRLYMALRRPVTVRPATAG
jgi:hypothetical protein